MKTFWWVVPMDFGNGELTMPLIDQLPNCMISLHYMGHTIHFLIGRRCQNWWLMAIHQYVCVHIKYQQCFVKVFLWLTLWHFSLHIYFTIPVLSDMTNMPDVVLTYRQVYNIRYNHFIRQLNCWSLRCSWSIACRHCSNYIFILDLTPGFNTLRKDNCKPRPEAFKFWD